MQQTSDDRLSMVFAALADPTRRAILARLAEGEAPVSELAQPFRISQPAISKHLKVLERAGLVAKSAQAQWRRCRLEPAPLREVAGWMEDYREFWDESFKRLDEHLRRMQKDRTEADKEKRDDDPHLERDHAERLRDRHDPHVRRAPAPGL